MMHRSKWSLLVIIVAALVMLDTVGIVAAQNSGVPIPEQLDKLQGFNEPWQWVAGIALLVWAIVTMIKPDLKKLSNDNRVIQLTALGIALLLHIGASLLFKSFPFGESFATQAIMAFIATAISMIGASAGKIITNKPSEPAAVG